jgi:hypothetical protein
MPAIEFRNVIKAKNEKFMFKLYLHCLNEVSGIKKNKNV